MNLSNLTKPFSCTHQYYTHRIASHFQKLKLKILPHHGTPYTGTPIVCIPNFPTGHFMMQELYSLPSLLSKDMRPLPAPSLNAKTPGFIPLTNKEICALLEFAKENPQEGQCEAYAPNHYSSATPACILSTP